MFACPCWSPSRKGDCLNLDWVIGSSYPIKISVHVPHNIYKMFSNCLQVCNSDSPRAQPCNHSSSFIPWDLKSWKYLFPLFKQLTWDFFPTRARHPSFPQNSKFLAPKGCTARAGTQTTLLVWKGHYKNQIDAPLPGLNFIPIIDGKEQDNKRRDVWQHTVNNSGFHLKNPDSFHPFPPSTPVTCSVPRLLTLGLPGAAFSFLFSLLWGSWERSSLLWRAPTDHILNQSSPFFLF